MIDFTKLTDEELFEHKEDVDNYIRSIKIKEPDFHLYKSIQIEDTSYVNPDTLIPTLEFKISVNKEDIQHFRTLWGEYYNKQNQFFRYHRSLSPEKQVTLDIKHQIERQFADYLDSLFPVVHYG
jgi:hypothetical protein